MVGFCRLNSTVECVPYDLVLDSRNALKLIKEYPFSGERGLQLKWEKRLMWPPPGVPTKSIISYLSIGILK